jgi:hypothetical protein
LEEDAIEERSTVLGLHLRSFSFFFAGATLRPPYSAQDDDPTGFQVVDLRLSLAHTRPALKLVLHGQVAGLLRTSSGRGALGLGRGLPPLRFFPLQYDSGADDPVQIRTSIDWAYLAYRIGPVTISVGRQPITYGRGRIWHPTDLISQFALTEVDTEYKPGADALRVDWAVAAGQQLTLIAVAGELDDDHDAEASLRGSSFLLRYQLGVLRGEIGITAALIRRDAVLAVDGSFDLGRVDLYGELTLTIPTAGSLWPREKAADQLEIGPVVPRALVGLSLKAIKKLTLGAEVYFNGFGRYQPRDYVLLLTSERLRVGELTNTGMFYAGVLAEWQVHPLINLGGVLLSNVRDPSGLLLLSVRYNVAPNVELQGGVYLPMGRHPDLRRGFEVRSEFGLYPTFAFIELKLAI